MPAKNLYAKGFHLKIVYIPWSTSIQLFPITTRASVFGSACNFICVSKNKILLSSLTILLKVYSAVLFDDQAASSKMFLSLYAAKSMHKHVVDLLKSIHEYTYTYCVDAVCLGPNQRSLETTLYSAIGLVKTRIWTRSYHLSNYQVM